MSGRNGSSRDGDTQTLPPVRPRARGRSGLWWLLPAIALVLGIVVGAVAVGAVTSGADRTASPPQATTGGASSTSTPTGSLGVGASGGGTPSAVTVTVPAACTTLADDARKAADLLSRAATAARDLDANRLADIVRQMQDTRDALTAHSSECTAATSPSASG